MIFKKIVNYLENFSIHRLSNKYKLIVNIVIITTLSSTIITFINITMPLELMLYDLNFLIRKPELTDKNIVIVDWNNEDIVEQNEQIMSNTIFFKLLENIEEQRPRVIGMTIPINLKPNNEDSFSKGYRKPNNLIIGQKIIDPPRLMTILNQEEIQREESAALDVPPNLQSIITRDSYVYPVAKAEQNPFNTKGIPYLGVKAAYDFLKQNSFTIEENYDDHKPSVIIKSQKNEKIKVIRSSSTNRNDKNNNITSFYLPINWRKAEKYKKNFERISVSNILNNEVPRLFFYNKIVLIGNTSDQITRKHFIPISRWDNSSIHEVDIAAHVASSIIDNILENRPLINKTNVSQSLIIIAAAIYAIIISNTRIDNLLFISTSCTLSITLSLIVLNIFCLFNGIWLLVIGTILNTWLIYFRTTYLNYIQIKNNKITNMELFIGNLQHNIGNNLNSMHSSSDTIDHLLRENSITSSTNSKIIKMIETDDLITIFNRNRNIINQIKRIQQFQIKTQQYLSYSHNLKDNQSFVYKNINLFLQETINNIFYEVNELAELDYSIDMIEIQYFLDTDIKESRINTAAIEIPTDNIIKNALFAIDPELQSPRKKKNYTPRIVIKTKLLKNKNRFQITIQDNGIGIPKDLTEKIFHQFKSYRAKYKSNSQGLGLFLTSTALSKHGGKINLESDFGVGSKFTIDLPYLTKSSQ